MPPQFTALAFSAEVPPRLTLRGGEGTPIPNTGLALLLTGITDQRCPPQVDCFWEGMIRAEITVLGPKPNLQQIVLCNLCDDGSRSATVGGVNLPLVSLIPSTEDLTKLGRAALLTYYTLVVAVEPAKP